MEKRRHSQNVVPKIVEFRENPVVEIASEETHATSDGDQSSRNNDPRSVVGHPPGSGVTSRTQSNHSSWLSRHYSMVRSKCSKFIRDLFEKWIPGSLRGYPFWLVAFLALGVGMGCVVTVSPGLQRPKSSDFQLFLSSHILEQYELKYKNRFRYEGLAEKFFYVYIIFGFKATDTGNHLDPTDYGTLQYDHSFDILQPEAQKWFFNDLCSDIRKQKFFRQNTSWNCFPEVRFSNENQTSFCCELSS
jgi:hypothetical protein